MFIYLNIKIFIFFFFFFCSTVHYRQSLVLFFQTVDRLNLCFRYRSGGGKSQNQNELTVEELRSFVQQLDNLPCNIRQAPLLKVSISGSIYLFITYY